MQSTWEEAHSRLCATIWKKECRLWRSRGRINATFHTAYSRNAAIGRARRMGLSGLDPSERARPAEIADASRARCGFTRCRKRRGKIPAAAADFEAGRALQLRCVGIVPRHLSLLELEAGDCRYPFGGDAEGEAITFCGHPRREGSSYCVSHFHLTRGIGSASERSAVKVLLRLVEAA